MLHLSRLVVIVKIIVRALGADFIHFPADNLMSRIEISSVNR